MNQSIFSTLLLGLACSSSNHAEPLTDIPIAYAMVAKNFQIPSDILYAVAITESGQLHHESNVPWPWALNIDGESVYCETQNQAIDVLTEAVQHGKSVDIGLMQVSWRWHKQRFLTLEDALSPIKNLTIGATILREQYEQTGDWWESVGRYHDPGQDEGSLDSARNYRERVEQNWRVRF